LFEHYDSAITYLEQAAEMAAAHKLNKLLFEAESAIVDAKRRERVQPAVAVSVSEVDGSGLDEIAEAIESMKELAGVH